MRLTDYIYPLYSPMTELHESKLPKLSSLFRWEVHHHLLDVDYYAQPCIHDACTRSKTLKIALWDYHLSLRAAESLLQRTFVGKAPIMVA